MTINKTTTDLSTLKINYLTKEMYEDALANQEINENELYITPGSGTIDSTSVPTANKIAEFDSTAHMNSTDMTSQEVDDFVDGLNISGGGGILDVFHPVGSYYETSDTTFNPNTAWGGTWELVPLIEPVAWFQWNNETLAHSNNFSSVTATATGVFTCVFTNAMADTDYLVSVSAESSGLGGELCGVYGKATTQFLVDFCKYDGTTIKPTYVSVVVHGRLANTSKNRWHRTA